MSNDKPYYVSQGNLFSYYVKATNELNLCNILIELKWKNVSSPQSHKNTIECIVSNPILSILFLFIGLSFNRIIINQGKVGVTTQISFKMPD